MDADVILLHPIDRSASRGQVQDWRAERYPMHPEQIEAVAKIAYEAVRAYREVTRRDPLPLWERAEPERKHAMTTQVRYWLKGRRVREDALREMELEDMRAWRLFGAVCAAVTAVA